MLRALLFLCGVPGLAERTNTGTGFDCGMEGISIDCGMEGISVRTDIASSRSSTMTEVAGRESCFDGCLLAVGRVSAIDSSKYSLRARVV